MGGTKVLLLVLLIGWEDSTCLNWNPVPRKTIKYHGELSLATLHGHLVSDAVRGSRPQNATPISVSPCVVVYFPPKRKERS